MDDWLKEEMMFGVMGDYAFDEDAENEPDPLGKEKCRLLRELRRDVAESFDIYIEGQDIECNYDGTCKGHCLKCDAEVEYINQKLEEKAKELKLAGLEAADILKIGLDKFMQKSEWLLNSLSSFQDEDFVLVKKSDYNDLLNREV